MTQHDDGTRYEELLQIDRAVAKQIRKRQQLRRLFRVLIVVFIVTAAIMVWMAAFSADETLSAAADAGRREGERAGETAASREVTRRLEGITEETADALVGNELFVTKLSDEFATSSAFRRSLASEISSRAGSTQRIEALERNQRAMRQQIERLVEAQTTASSRGLEEFRRSVEMRITEIDQRVDAVHTENRRLGQQAASLEERIQELEDRLESVERRQDPTSYVVKTGRTVRIAEESMQIEIGKPRSGVRYRVVVRDLDGVRLYPTGSEAAIEVVPGEVIEFTVRDIRYALVLTYRLPRLLVPDYLGLELKRIIG